MSNKLFIFGMAVTCLCGFSTKGFATTNSFKAPAGTDTVCQVPYAENFNDASKVCVCACCCKCVYGGLFFLID